MLKFSMLYRTGSKRIDKGNFPAKVCGKNLSCEISHKLFVFQEKKNNKTFFNICKYLNVIVVIVIASLFSLFHRYKNVQCSLYEQLFSTFYDYNQCTTAKSLQPRRQTVWQTDFARTFQKRIEK